MMSEKKLFLPRFAGKALLLPMLTVLTLAAAAQVSGGDWVNVPGQAGLDYRWSHAEANGPAFCQVELRTADADSHASYVGSLTFVDASGKTATRSIEPSVLPGGRIHALRVGPNCASVTAMRLTLRPGS